jgi:hypothetical protein
MFLNEAQEPPFLEQAVWYTCPGYNKLPPDCSGKSPHWDALAQQLSPLFSMITCKAVQPGQSLPSEVL